jgi:HAD superfamily hydrolase (TIGR01490 family)
VPVAAFFDLDKTILAKSTALAFAGPMYEAQLLTRLDLARSAQAQLVYVSSRADHALMEKLKTYLSAMVAGWEVATLQKLIETHLEAVVTPLIYAEATALIHQHREAGRLIVLVTSTGAEMADPIGTIVGADQVLRTTMVERNGHYTGEIADYMYGPRKAEAVHELAADLDIDLDASYGYSDSITDLPLLEAVGHPHAVNPDRVLRRTAQERGWPVLDFRDAPVLAPRRPRLTYLTIAAASLALGALGAYVALRRRDTGQARRHAEGRQFGQV